MDFALIPSLEDIVLTNVAISLWNQQDIAYNLSRMSQTNICTRSPQWQVRYSEIEGNVMASVNKLILPERLKKKLLNSIKPVGWQMFTWFYYQRSYWNLDIKQKVNFCWTPRGTLDTKKTAKILVQDENLDFDTRLQIAGIHCLEEDYYSLCEKYSEICKFKDIKSSDGSFALFVKSCLQEEFSLHKTCIGTIYNYIHDDDLSPNEYMFRCAAANANEAAVRYLLPKLTSEEKEKTLVRMACYVAMGRNYFPGGSHPSFCYKSCFTNVFCFLLSVMTEEQQVAVFKKEPGYTVMCFLEHPWQYHFLDVLERVETFLLPRDAFNVMTAIYYKIKPTSEDYDYECLFQIVWQRIPDAIKICWLERPFFIHVLSTFSSYQNVKSDMLILKDILVLREKDFIFQNGGMEICRCLIRGNRFDLLEFFIQKNISSENLMQNFKNELRDFLYSYPLEHESNSKATRRLTFEI